MAWQAVIGTFVRMFTARPQGQGTGVTEFAVFFFIYTAQTRLPSWSVDWLRIASDQALDLASVPANSCGTASEKNLPVDSIIRDLRSRISSCSILEGFTE